MAGAFIGLKLGLATDYHPAMLQNVGDAFVTSTGETEPTMSHDCILHYLN
eukprot:gene17354-19088_t